jgi:hypothetical protein
MENVVEFLNTTCTLLLSKTQQNLIMGLEPTIILQGISVFISVMIYMKVFSVNVFKPVPAACLVYLYAFNKNVCIFNKFVFTLTKIKFRCVGVQVVRL